MNTSTMYTALCGSLLSLLSLGCQAPSEDYTWAAALEARSGSSRSNQCKLSKHLGGEEEVPARDTNAQGQVLFRFNADETALEYKLIVANIDNVVAAHIHAGLPGTNGPIVVFLAGPFDAGGGPSNGVLAEGIITAGNLINGLAQHPLSDLAALMTSGGAYANVHTNDGATPTNTGPGDFPGGEIRGQIRPIGQACDD